MSRYHLIVALIAMLTALPLSAAWGNTLDVSPVRVHLSQAQRSQTLSLHNRSSNPVRYQVQVHAWIQTDDGEMKLSPSRDLVAFPSLLTFKPGETRRVKLAAVAGPELVEKTYRIVLEPLPGSEPDQDAQIRVLTRINLPVFVQPAQPTPEPALHVELRKRSLIVTVSNTGSSYFVSRSIQVVGRRANGGPTHTELPGWYVLAGDERIYTIPLSQTRCAELESITVTLKTEAQTRIAVAKVQGESCGT